MALHSSEFRTHGPRRKRSGWKRTEAKRVQEYFERTGDARHLAAERKWAVGRGPASGNSFGEEVDVGAQREQERTQEVSEFLTPQRYWCAGVQSMVRKNETTRAGGRHKQIYLKTMKVKKQSFC